jgi:hypothetical protein
LLGSSVVSMYMLNSLIDTLFMTNDGPPTPPPSQMPFDPLTCSVEPANVLLWTNPP